MLMGAKRLLRPECAFLMPGRVPGSDYTIYVFADGTFAEHQSVPGVDGLWAIDPPDGPRVFDPEVTRYPVSNALRLGQIALPTRVEVGP